MSFTADAVGAPPSGWTCGMTGQGRPRWTVQPEAGKQVLVQSGAATFPWCVVSGSAVADGWVEVKFKPLRGREDQAGGLVWRWKDGDHYYVARANALENNVSLYYTEGGTRKKIQYVDTPVQANMWHTLRVAFSGTRIQVSFDGQPKIDLQDAHIAGPGKVGVWTKADSVTAFDAFSYGP